jgi:hypothetical protein
VPPTMGGEPADSNRASPGAPTVGGGMQLERDRRTLSIALHSLVPETTGGTTSY